MYFKPKYLLSFLLAVVLIGTYIQISKLNGPGKLECITAPVLATAGTVPSKFRQTFPEIQSSTSVIPDDNIVVDGWGYNTSRNVSDYIFAENRTPLAPIHLPVDFCATPSFLLVIICSHPAYLDKRKVIRKTWAQHKLVLDRKISYYYLLGNVSDPDLQGRIDTESEIYGDVIQEPFMDAYNNLTLKSLFMLKRVSDKCLQNTRYLFKSDDDTYVHIPGVIEMIHGLPNTRLLIGKRFPGSVPIRDTGNKWYAPRYLYAGNRYPPFVSGSGYLMSVDVAKVLFEASLETPLFHMEDVYLTGICAQKAGLENKLSTRFSLDPFKKVCDLFEKSSFHRMTEKDMVKLQDELNKDGWVEKCKQAMSFTIPQWLTHNVFGITTKRARS